jgi:hypothetical protein
LNARQRQVLTGVLNRFVGRLTTSKWSALAKYPADAALRDVA